MSGRVWKREISVAGSPEKRKPRPGAWDGLGAGDGNQIPRYGRSLRITCSLTHCSMTYCSVTTFCAFPASVFFREARSAAPSVKYNRGRCIWLAGLLHVGVRPRATGRAPGLRPSYIVPPVTFYMFLSRPRGAVGFGLAAVESAAASVVALTCGVCVVGGFGWL